MLYMFPLKIYPSFELKEQAGLKPILYWQHLTEIFYLLKWVCNVVTELPIGKSTSCKVINFCNHFYVTKKKMYKNYIQYNVHTKCHNLRNKKDLPALHFHKICNMQIKLDVWYDMWCAWYFDFSTGMHLGLILNDLYTPSKWVN